jgi:type 1 glutamine amidotransferase
MKQLYAFLGDYYHQPELIKGSIKQALEHLDLKGKFKIHFCDVEDLVSILQQKPDCIIIFKEDRVNPNEAKVHTWMTDEIELEITRYVSEGGSWLAWHSGLASYKVKGEFTQMLRGYFEYHPEVNQTVSYTTISNVNHGVVIEFEILDEHYFVHCDEANTEVFMRSKSIDGESIAGWRHPFGSGKVCCYTPAHRIEGLLDPNVISILGGNILWCCN